MALKYLGTSPNLLVGGEQSEGLATCRPLTALLMILLLMQYSPLCAMTKKMGYVSLYRLYEEGVKSECLHSSG